MLTIRRAKRKVSTLLQTAMILNQTFNSFIFCILAHKTQGLNTCQLFELMSTVQVSFITGKKEKRQYDQRGIIQTLAIEKAVNSQLWSELDSRIYCRLLRTSAQCVVASKVNKMISIIQRGIVKHKAGHICHLLGSRPVNSLLKCLVLLAAAPLKTD